MEQELIQKYDIIKIADSIEKEGNLNMYWDYNDKLTEEQIINIQRLHPNLNFCSQRLK